MAHTWHCARACQKPFVQRVFLDCSIVHTYTHTRTNDSEFGPKLFIPQIATIANFSCIPAYTKFKTRSVYFVCVNSLNISISVPCFVIRWNETQLNEQKCNSNCTRHNAHNLQCKMYNYNAVEMRIAFGRLCYRNILRWSIARNENF